MIEQNPVWAPIAPAPRPLWSTTAQIIEAYQRAERPVRIACSQRYSLTVTEALPEPVWRKP